MIYGTHGMDVKNAVKAVRTVTCIIWTECGIKMVHTSITQDQVFDILYRKTDMDITK